MRTFDSVWWTLAYPDNWAAEEDKACITILSESGFGAIQISSARNASRSATDEDLKDFARDQMEVGGETKPIRCGDFSGFYLQYAPDNKWWQRQWWLRCDNIVMFMSYTCSLQDKGKEDSMVDSIVNTLKMKIPESPTPA
jgi:hypothetical protein